MLRRAGGLRTGRIRNRRALVLLAPRAAVFEGAPTEADLTRGGGVVPALFFERRVP